MANQNTVVGFPSGLFVQSITSTTETALTVPATAGIFPGLPSPVSPAGAGLDIQVPTDVQFGELDGHPFKIRVAGKVFTGAALTFLPKLYYVPAAVAASATSGTLTNDSVVVALAATSVTGASNFVVEAEFLWDSTSKILGGFVTSAQIGGVNIVANSGTAGTNVATTAITTTYTAGTPVSLLNFIPSFTFGTANAANTVQVTEFVVDRV
jgi:hypothetical protein